MKELRGLDEWITRDDRVELPTKVWWVEDYEDAGSFETHEEAVKFVLQFGNLEMQDFPEDYVYESEVE